MTRMTPLWQQEGSYAASMDRQLIGSLWPDSRTSGMAVTAAGGTTVNIAPGQAVVPTQTNTGSTLCASNANEALLMPSAPAATYSRIDLVIVEPHGPELDGGATADWRFWYVTGVETTGTPVVPATPAGTTVLARILRPGGSGAIAAGDITDVRPGALSVPGGVPASYPRGIVANGRGPASQISGGVALFSWSPGVTVYPNRKYRLYTFWQIPIAAAGSFWYIVYGSFSPGDPIRGGMRFHWIAQTLANGQTFYGSSSNLYEPTSQGLFSVSYSYNGPALGTITPNAWQMQLDDIGGT